MKKGKRLLKKIWVFLVVAAAIMAGTAVLYACILSAQRMGGVGITQVETPALAQGPPAPPELAKNPAQKAYSVTMLSPMDAYALYPDAATETEGTGRAWEQFAVSYMQAAELCADATTEITGQTVTETEVWEQTGADAPRWGVRAVLPDGQYYLWSADAQTGDIMEGFWQGWTGSPRSFGSVSDAQAESLLKEVEQDLADKLDGVIGKDSKLWWIAPSIEGKEGAIDTGRALAKGNIMFFQVGLWDGRLYDVGYALQDQDRTGAFTGVIESLVLRGYWTGAQEMPTGAVLVNEREQPPYLLPQFEVLDSATGQPALEESDGALAARHAVKYAEVLFGEDMEGATVRVTQGPNVEMTLLKDGQPAFAARGQADGIQEIHRSSVTEIAQDAMSDSRFAEASGACVVQIKRWLEDGLLRGATVRNVVNVAEWDRQSGGMLPACQFDVFLNDGRLLRFGFSEDEDGDVSLLFFQISGEEEARAEEERLLERGMW